MFVYRVTHPMMCNSDLDDFGIQIWHILFQGAQSDCEDENSCTPLMFAAMRNHPGSVA